MFRVKLLTGNQEDGKIPNQLLPFVYEKLSIFLTKQASFLKEEIILETVKPFIQKMENEMSNDEETTLRKEIEELNKDIEECPSSKRYDAMRESLKKELKEKETALLKLMSGSSNVLALDALDGASQLY